MRSRVLVALWAVAAAAIGHACEYPEFHYYVAGGDGGSGADAAAGAAGSAGGGGVGGTAGPCDVYSTGTCGPGMKCSVVDELTGETGCVPAGDRQHWSICNNDVECVEGSWCDHPSGICKPVCPDPAQCRADAQCLSAKSLTGPDIPGLSVCTSHCEPVAVDPCDQTWGDVNCVYVESLEECDCQASDGMSAGAECTEHRQCAPGHLCTATEMAPALKCRLWCTPVGFIAPCVVGYCDRLSDRIWYRGVEYGACVTPL